MGADHVFGTTPLCSNSGERRKNKEALELRELCVDSCAGKGGAARRLGLIFQFALTELLRTLNPLLPNSVRQQKNPEIRDLRRGTKSENLALFRELCRAPVGRALGFSKAF